VSRRTVVIAIILVALVVTNIAMLGILGVRDERIAISKLRIDELQAELDLKDRRISDAEFRFEKILSQLRLCSGSISRLLLPGTGLQAILQQKPSTLEELRKDLEACQNVPTAEIGASSTQR
jgi:hypothetical protein